MTTIDCIPRDKLKQYLAGWIDESQVAQIEEHLETCDVCEHTVVELESTPDTIFDPLRQPAIMTPAVAETDSSLRQAVAKAAQLFEPGGHRAGTDNPSIPNILGAYELIRRLGYGGMGTVYLAKHKKLDKQVAIKFLPASWAENAEAAARFQREILATGKLNHPAIVSATDAGDQGSMHYLVMEYVEGIDLSRLTRFVQPLTIPDCCELMRQVALGLSHAHAGGIVHRDVKPSNVMLSNRGDVKVLDFGLAQFNPWDEAAAELTSVGQLMGTLDYMAPEQAERPNAVDYRADLYALGATLFRLLAGRAPLAAAPNLSPIDKLRLLAEHAPPRLDTLRPDAPPELVKLVQTLLDRRPEHRPASAAHVAEQLAPMCTGSDLVGLAARGCQASNANDSVLQNGMQKHLPSLRTKTAFASASSDASGRGHRWIRSLVILAFLAMLVAAGVLITLQTRKGQLVIESEVPGVHVKVLSDGKLVDDLRIETGTTSTRLAADNYEIVLDSPSNSITVDKNEFVLKSGETIIARIRQQQPPVQDNATKISVLDNAYEPVFEGKPLSYWLAQLSRERSQKAVGEALLAIDVLVQADNADRITKALVAALPTMKNIYLTDASDRNALSNNTAFDVLAKANPGKKYFELLVNLLNSGDVAWGKRILSHGAQSRMGSSDEDWEPLYRWMEENAFAETPRTATIRELAEPSAWVIYRVLNTSTLRKSNTEIEQRLLPLMEKSPYLGTAFWLSRPPLLPSQLPSPSRSQSSWSTAYRHVVSRQAFKAIQDPASDSKVVAQAAMILSELISKSYSDPELGTDQLTKLVGDRMAAVVNDSTRFWRLTEVESSFASLSLPRNVRLVQFPTNDAKASEIVELMDLATALKGQNEQLSFDVSGIISATRESYIKIASLFSPRRGSGLAMASIWKDRIQLAWPNLDTYQILGASPPRERLDPKDLLGFLICINASELGGIPLPALDVEGKSLEQKEAKATKENETKFNSISPPNGR